MEKNTEIFTEREEIVTAGSRTTITRKGRRALAKCRACGKGYKMAVTITETVTRCEDDSRPWLFGRTSRSTKYSSNLMREHLCCGLALNFQPVTGRTTRSPCDTRCTEAMGHRCECACGGANHGAGGLEI